MLPVKSCQLLGREWLACKPNTPALQDIVVAFVELALTCGFRLSEERSR